MSVFSEETTKTLMEEYPQMDVITSELATCVCNKINNNTNRMTCWPSQLLGLALCETFSFLTKVPQLTSEYQKLYTDLLPESLIFACQQATSSTKN